jgi:tetratricopeptide (TPR) repeat protein
VYHFDVVNVHLDSAPIPLEIACPGLSLMFGKKSYPLAIDIGSYAVKLVQLLPTKSGLSLGRLGMASLSPGAFEDGEVHEHEEVMRALALEPDHADAYFTLGLAHRQLGRISRSVKALEKMLELAPDHEKAKKVRAYVDAYHKKHERP